MKHLKETKVERRIQRTGTPVTQIQHLSRFFHIYSIYIFSSALIL